MLNLESSNGSIFKSSPFLSNSAPSSASTPFFPSFEFWEIFEFKENIFPKLWKLKKKRFHSKIKCWKVSSRENYSFFTKISEIFCLASLGIVNANIVGEFTASAVHKQIVVEASFWKIYNLSDLLIYGEFLKSHKEIL